jgi:hypothetical protein
LSVGFLVFTFISAPIANKNVDLIIWIGAVLAVLHLIFQLMARRDFNMRISQQPTN